MPTFFPPGMAFFDRNAHNTPVQELLALIGGFYVLRPESAGGPAIVGSARGTLDNQNLLPGTVVGGTGAKFRNSQKRESWSRFSVPLWFINVARNPSLTVGPFGRPTRLEALLVPPLGAGYEGDRGDACDMTFHVGKFKVATITVPQQSYVMPRQIPVKAPIPPGATIRVSAILRGTTTDYFVGPGAVPSLFTAQLLMATQHEEGPAL